MFLRNKRNETEILFAQLTLMRDWAQGLIAAGDPDNEDVIRRTYYATHDLLRMWDPQEEGNGA